MLRVCIIVNALTRMGPRGDCVPGVTGNAVHRRPSGRRLERGSECDRATGHLHVSPAHRHERVLIAADLHERDWRSHAGRGIGDQAACVHANRGKAQSVLRRDTVRHAGTVGVTGDENTPRIDVHTPRNRIEVREQKVGVADALRDGRARRDSSAGVPSGATTTNRSRSATARQASTSRIWLPLPPAPCSRSTTGHPAAGAFPSGVTRTAVRS